MGAAMIGAVVVGAGAAATALFAAACSIGLPHVMQKRMPGALVAPQRAHLIPSGAATGAGGIGTPMGGVGGAILGDRRAPQSSQKTR